MKVSKLHSKRKSNKPGPRIYIVMYSICSFTAFRIRQRTTGSRVAFSARQLAHNPFQLVESALFDSTI
jgi:hypothetical protein